MLLQKIDRVEVVTASGKTEPAFRVHYVPEGAKRKKQVTVPREKGKTDADMLRGIAAWFESANGGAS